jgi:hypothetical protein
VSDSKLVLDKLDELGTKITRIEGALYPDPGQPSRITQLEQSVSALQGWRNTLVGAWVVISAGLGLVVRKH